MTAFERGLLDTSVFIASETGRPLDTAALPLESLVSVVTLGELHAGVLAARDTVTRAHRLATFESVAGVEALPVDAAAARHWGRLRARLAETGQRISVNDLWIAAIAAANDLPIVTQDAGFDALVGVGGPPVVHI